MRKPHYKIQHICLWDDVDNNIVINVVHLMNIAFARIRFFFFFIAHKPTTLTNRKKCFFFAKQNQDYKYYSNSNHYPTFFKDSTVGLGHSEAEPYRDGGGHRSIEFITT